MRKIAGAITTFARPDYYKQALDSLAKCDGVYDGIDWYIYQDGLRNFPEDRVRYYNIKQEDVDRNIMITLDHEFEFLHHYVEKENRGINHQMNRIFNLFKKGYDVLFIFEDDLVVSPHYITLLRNCSKQHKDISVTFHSLPSSPNTRPLKSLHLLRPAKQPRCWGWYLTKEVWDKIGIVWEREYPHIKGRTPYYDTKITQALRRYAGGKYESVVSRAFNVGLDGTLTMNERNWKRRGLDRQTKRYIYQQDSSRTNFQFTS